MISKDKVMLQIPVRKEIAKSWKNILNQSKMKAEDLFTAMYVNLLKSIRKVGDENGESKENNSKKA